MCNAAGNDSSVPATPAPALGSFKASAHQLLHPVDGDDDGHALQFSKVRTLRVVCRMHILLPLLAARER